ncbi:MAG: tetratricopeptide repeat protein, partial [Acidobacteriota bacterium]|nr:tetratricopeptide repeat protein [Acidobacteriota bacterium]
MTYLAYRLALAVLVIAFCEYAGAQNPAQLKAARKLLEQSQAELATGDYQRAIERAREAVPLLQTAGDMANAGLALNTLGSAQLYRGDYEAARVSFEQSLEIERAINNGNAEVARLNNIGNVYFFEGQYLEALRQYERALDVIKRRGDESWVPRRRQLTLANLATLYEQVGQNQHALDLYRRLRTEPSALTPGEQAQFLSNLGTL